MRILGRCSLDDCMPVDGLSVYGVVAQSMSGNKTVLLWFERDKIPEHMCTVSLREIVRMNGVD